MAIDLDAVSLMTLERFEQIAQDTKKEFTYRKGHGEWYWSNRGEVVSMWDGYQGPFDTRYEALRDAIDPYIGEESDETESITAHKS